ncbi:MAG TPA: glycine oxidase ThiO [Vicinamibacterales bacterium]|nr:glycine oxidase ThiO [Vicinamibacterales bacterium]
MTSPSVIVVGAGIVGCTIAYELARSGARVHVIEARAPAQGATRASAGILAPFIEGHGASLLRDLGKRSLDLYDAFIARLAEDSNHTLIYRRNGTFELAFSPEDVTRLRELSALLADRGIDCSWIEPRHFSDYEPAASPQAVGALLVPAHGYVGVTSLTLAAAAAAEIFGARFTIETGAIRILPMAGGRVGVHTPGITLDADRVVLAAGSWSSQITVDGVDAIPVKPIRGQLIQLQTGRGAIERVIWGPDGYLVPWPDGSVLVGSTVEDVGFDETHTPDAVERLRSAAVSMIPSLAAAEMSGVRTGLRPKGPDDLPILGHSQVVPGLIYATAHYRNGVLFTPLTMELVREMIFDRAADPALRDLDPSRVGVL